ncbi:MAG: hypothetical protein IPP35_10865 [Elusimicrobia bacterium]|nr:hypothetical protein [Elusimicrobiota bacterium]
MAGGKERVAVAGLARLAAWIFFVWGALAVGKGLWDCFGGQPETNFFSPTPWTFISRAQWLRYAGFELAYGLACVGVGLSVWTVSRRLPVWIERATSDF